nr:hypothetical protein [Tanacetum cinerariifolium]
MEEETEELKKHLQIVTDDDDDDDVYIDATPLASNIPIVDCKIHTERNRPYFKIIRADGNHMLFISLSTMLKNFDREDLKSLWKIIRDRFEKTKQKNYLDDYLLNTLKIMFEKPNVEASMWKDQKGKYGLAKVKSWKLIESCGVYCITFLTTHIFLRVEMMYSLIHFTLEQMLNDIRLQVEDESEMSLELLRLVRRQLNEDQIADKYKANLGYNVVPPPYTRNFLPPKPNLSGLEEFENEPKISEPRVKKTVVEASEAKASKDKPKVATAKVKNINGRHNYMPSQLEGLSNHYRIYVTPSHTKKIFRNMKRIRKDFSGMVIPLFPTMMVQAQKEMGEESAAYEVVNEEMNDRLVRAATIASGLEAEQDSGNIAKTQSKATPNESSSQGTDSRGSPVAKKPWGILLLRLDLREYLKFLMIYCSQELTYLKVGLSARVESSDDEGLGEDDASKQGRIINDLNADEDIILMNDQEMFYADEDLQGEEVVVEQEKSHEKGKAKMIEEPVKLNKKDQILFDEEVARKLQEEINEQERLAGERARQEEESNIALIETWEDIQANMDVDYHLAERMQAEEQQELNEEEKAKLFMELLEKRRKFFAAKRTKEKRNRPPTIAQQRKITQEESSKTAGDELEQNSSKKHKIDDDTDTAELKQLVSIISDEEGVAVDAIPLVVKPPSIVDWKVIKENFDREDVETLWRLVKAKHGLTRPEEGYERVLWGDLKVMFDPHVEDEV